jgi:hypothetical protein
MLKKPEPKSNGSVDALSASCEGSLPKRLPTLAEWLSACQWEDGSLRVTSTLSVSVADGKWKLRINDRDGERVAFLSGDTLDGVLDSLERALVKSSVDWRHDDFAKGTAKGKKG